MASTASKIGVLRGIASELKRNSSVPLKDNLMYNYIMQQYRRNATTEKQICKAHEELNFMASTYLCYMKSARIQNEINQEYSGKGERSIQETANLVGFKLPHDPK
ncbi:protein FMC1 homolog isoform X2 [Atheta coriaria]|uniref:protein FMC1 homolog isoform X2 n=1 Tax=Dalotia coriaria TaxID=877792 RepID=UPI0031F4674E